MVWELRPASSQFTALSAVFARVGEAYHRKPPHARARPNRNAGIRSSFFYRASQFFPLAALLSYGSLTVPKITPQPPFWGNTMKALVATMRYVRCHRRNLYAAIHRM